MVQRKDVVKTIRNLKLRPVRKDGVFLLLDEIAGEQTSGGIYLPPDTQQGEVYRYATVISVGDMVVDVAPGHRVLVGKYYGQEIKHEDSSICKLVMVSQDQIAAKID